MTRRAILFALMLAGTARAQTGPVQVARPVVNIAAVEDLRALQHLLETVPPRLGCSDKSPVAPSYGSAALRLSLFRRRFGRSPESLPQWDEVRQAAARRLQEMDEHDELLAQQPEEHRSHASESMGGHESGYPRPLGSHETDWMEDLDRFVLRTITGEVGDPDQALDAVRVPYGSKSPWRIDRALADVAARRSELLESRSDARGALAAMHTACLGVVGYSPEPRDGLLFARYGLLLLDNGFESEGAALLAGLVRAQPGSPGAVVASDALADIDPERVPAGAGLHELYVNTMKPLHAIAVSVPQAGRPSRITILAAQLGCHGSRSGARVTVLGAGNFEWLRPALIGFLRSGSFRSAGVALTLLHALSGGGRPYVAECLDRLGSFAPTATGTNAHGFDEAFRLIYGDGPDQSEARRMQPRWIADAWREWLAAR